MRKGTVSKYKNNCIASKKKCIYARLLDYFSLFVSSYIVYTIFYAVGSGLPVVKNISDRLLDENQCMASYLDSTHLQRLNADKTSLMTIDSSAYFYTLEIAKTSAYVHDKPFPIVNPDKTIDYVPVNVEETFVFEREKYELDNLSYYFKYIKYNDPSLSFYFYDGVNYKEDIDTYMYIKAMEINPYIFVSADNENLIARGNGVSHYTVLTPEYTDLLLNFYMGDKTSTTVFDTVFLGYIKAAQFGIADVEANSSTYKSLLADYNTVYQELTIAMFVIYLLSYLLAFILQFGIVALICRRFVTLGQRVLSLGMCDQNEFEPHPVRKIAYYLLDFVLFFSSSAIAFYFMGLAGVFSMVIFPGFTFLGILIAIFILNIVSLFMPLFNKRHQNLSTFITRILTKDTKEFEGPVDVIESIDNNEGYGSRT